eukprot:scaffold9695_cov181-Amphora_coffeaeformis.AAC.6
MNTPTGSNTIVPDQCLVLTPCHKERYTVHPRHGSQQDDARNVLQYNTTSGRNTSRPLSSSLQQHEYIKAQTATAQAFHPPGQGRIHISTVVASLPLSVVVGIVATATAVGSSFISRTSATLTDAAYTLAGTQSFCHHHQQHILLELLARHMLSLPLLAVASVVFSAAAICIMGLVSGGTTFTSGAHAIPLVGCSCLAAVIHPLQYRNDINGCGRSAHYHTIHVLVV